MEGTNVDILAGAANLISVHAGPLVVCGDLQNGLEEVYDVGVPQLLGDSCYLRAVAMALAKVAR